MSWIQHSKEIAQRLKGRDMVATVAKDVDKAVENSKRRGKMKKVILACEFTGASIGGQTARLGVKVGRGLCTLEAADEYFVDRRLNVVILSKPAGSREDQGALPGMPENVESDTVFSAVVDVKGFAVKPDTISLGFTFSKKDIDLATLSRCVNRQGQFTITNIDDIPEADQGGKSEEGDEE